MRLALAPKVAVVEEDKAVAEEDEVVAEEDKGVADQDQRVAIASNHRHFPPGSGICPPTQNRSLGQT